MNKFLKDIVSRINNPKYADDFRFALLNPDTAICKDFLNLITKQMLEQQALFIIQTFQYCVAQHLMDIEKTIILDKKAAENQIEQTEILRHHAVAPVIQHVSKLPPSILQIMSGALPENIADLTTQISQLSAELVEVNKAKSAIKASWEGVNVKHIAEIHKDLQARGVQLVRNDGQLADMVAIVKNAVSTVDPVTVLEKVVASHALVGNTNAIPTADFCYKVSNVNEEIRVLAQLGSNPNEQLTGAALLQALRNNKKNCQLKPSTEKKVEFEKVVGLIAVGKALENSIQVREEKCEKLSAEKAAEPKRPSPFDLPNPAETPKLTRDK